MARFALIAVVMTAALVGHAFAWGPDGHTLVGDIAQTLLTQTAVARVKATLTASEGTTLGAVANWADEIKSEHEDAWSYPLHYVDTPDGACGYVHSRDCVDVTTGTQLPNFCVAGAIANYSSIIAKDHAKAYNELDDEALKFLSHFFGDIHQPLHVGFTSDRGGNNIKVYFFEKSSNLHSIWDTSIIEKRVTDDFSGSLDSFREYLINRINTDWKSEVSAWSTCADGSAVCPDAWAVESVALACQYAYKNVTDGDHLADDYYKSSITVIEEQLAKGAVRLAAAVNSFYPASTYGLSSSHRRNLTVGAIVGISVGVVAVVVIAMIVARRARSRTEYVPI